MMENFYFPFSAILGQDRMRVGLVLNAINPRIGGLLIRGEKGSGKSTAARAIQHLLPEITVMLGCPFNCGPDDIEHACESCRLKIDRHEPLKLGRQRVPFVELPVGASKDRVIGALEVSGEEQRLVKRLQFGLLARVNRGILYIDEVNMLGNELIEPLLDSAVTGVNVVERNEASVRHPAAFILIGTMNPEEGGLRPQLLDRFGLAVEVQRVQEMELRAEIVERRIRYEQDPAAFMQQWTEPEEQERQRIARGRELLPQVKITEVQRRVISRICAEEKTDGLRADLAIYKASLTLAAYRGRTEVTEDDIKDASELALLHRTRRS
jgi:Mg-chelatase subunit ChlI